MQVKAKVKKAAPAKRPSTSKRAPRNAAAQAPKKVEKKVARKATTTTSTKATKRAEPARRAKTMSNEAKHAVFKRFIREHHISAEQTSELQSHIPIRFPVYYVKKKN